MRALKFGWKEGKAKKLIGVEIRIMPKAYRKRKNHLNKQGVSLF
ncbi:hypothetical protein GCM10007940_21460 [Portibacter lacus]|uniref:Uncharacterized protein n=1 Tax=Portibacter lacus TaxID=1099794 RepID=A0AA37WD57_9BACT|nr:hypothetical protein GCM10007940_21460 [Portibacter lacus]